MKTHNNTLTIIRKEFARFFGDRHLLFTTVIMPGMLIYVVYSLMGSAIRSLENADQQELITVWVENLSPALAPALASPDSSYALVSKDFDQSHIDQLHDDDVNIVLMRFPQGFDSLIASYSPLSGLPAPNVEIYYNSANSAANLTFLSLQNALSAYENAQANLFDINRPDTPTQTFNQATDEQVLGDILSKIFPMLLVMLLFSGVMAIAPTSIAGEKERGTIATLLVTPMRRNHLALGKIISLSAIALLSGISSFLSIILSLPNIIAAEAPTANIPLNYTPSDYLSLLLVILATVLILTSVVSLISARAKDVKNASTMITPLMLLVMLAGLIPMFQTDPASHAPLFLIPLYNSLQVMADILAHSLNWLHVALTLGSNIAYTALSIWGLTRMFNSERIMFNT